MTECPFKGHSIVQLGVDLAVAAIAAGDRERKIGDDNGCEH